MEYKGKLYGHLGGKMYFYTGKTADDWDALEKRVSELEAENQALQEQIASNSLQPFTGEMWSFLLANALRCLTEEQRAGLCFDLYSRNEQTESIDKKIELLKLESKNKL